MAPDSTLRDTFRRAAVVGATAWGTTLAVHLARNGTRTTLVTREGIEAATLQRERSNARRLPGVAFPDDLAAVGGAAGVRGADLVVFAVPSGTLLANVHSVAAAVALDATILSATKGIEVATGRRMTELLAEALPGRSVAAISGPNLSREVVAGLPGSTVIASRGGRVDALRAAFHSTALRVYTSEDVAGVEFGGALKNVIAIAAGMVDALGFGDNAKAALLTRGLAEITRLGAAAGADPLTFQGLAGIGDLVATSYSPLSRNRRLGELVGGGESLASALQMLGETAEGVTTVPAALRLASRLGVEMPITEGLQRVLRDGQPPLEAMRVLMGREPRSER
ncbi:MAG: NAD(P)-dependent glycerol-3-phosphate dehydrogenase [Dehalococcoidia bacterium]|nr:MAG: NAD(P)-dependent glycerol-3-phosphate dehydrogenase [Dehalococcoidia bacterium]